MISCECECDDGDGRDLYHAREYDHDCDCAFDSDSYGVYIDRLSTISDMHLDGDVVDVVVVVLITVSTWLFVLICDTAALFLF